MRSKPGHIGIIAILTVLVAAVLGVSRFDTAERTFSFSIISPLADAELPVSRTHVLGANRWFPKESTVSAVPDISEVKARAFISVDLDSSRVLYARNHRKRMPVASLVKMMTALVALEQSEPDQVLEVPDQAVRVGEDSMGLSRGEQLSLEELLYGLFLVSGNDAAETIATSTYGRRELFIDLMNTKAAEMGLKDTHFINPTGLMKWDEEKEVYRALEYSTAYDLAVIGQALLQDELITKIAATPEYALPDTLRHKYYRLFSQTNFLTTDERVKGLKMGYTPAAGLCGVTYAESNDKHILIVVLGTPNRKGDIKILLDKSFQKIS